MSKKKQPKPVRTWVDAKAQVLRCNSCGETVPVPLGHMAWFTGVTNAFIKAHRDCEPGGMQATFFSVPKDVDPRPVKDDILAVLEDLLVQATKERSHFYVAAVARTAITEIKQLRGRRLGETP